MFRAGADLSFSGLCPLDKDLEALKPYKPERNLEVSQKLQPSNVEQPDSQQSPMHSTTSKKCVCYNQEMHRNGLS